MASSPASIEAGNPAAERALLAAAMTYGAEAIYLATDKGISAASFHRTTHAALWELMAGMEAEKQPITMLSVCNEITTDPDRYGGLREVSSIPDGCPALEAVPYWADTIQESKQRRDLSRIAHQMIDDIEAGEPPASITAAVSTRIDSVSHRADSSVKTGRQMADMLWSGITTDQTAPLELGDRILNQLFGCALVPGRFSLIAARPGQGKTAVILNLLYLVLCRHRQSTVAFLSLEQPAEQIAMRMAAIDGATTFSKLTDRPMGMEPERWHTPKAWAALIEHAEMVAQWGDRWVVDDRPGMSLPYIRSRLVRLTKRAAAMGRPLALVGLDYVQICKLGKADTRAQGLADLSNGLAGLAKDLKVPLVVLAQLNRGSENRGSDPEPKLSDLKGSGGLEEAAEAVFGLWRPNQERPGYQDELMMVKRMKNRNGSLMRAELEWQGKHLQIRGRG